MERDHNPVGRALRIVDDVWSELRKKTQWSAALKEIPVIPRVSYDSVVQRANRAAVLAADIDALDSSGLPADLRLTVQVAQWHARRWVREPDWYWTAFDPTGKWFGLFGATAYCGGYFLNGVLASLQRLTFDEAADLDRCLALVADYSRLVRELKTRTAEQAARGIYMPAVQLQQAIPLLEGLRARSIAQLSLFATNAQHIATPAFGRELELRLHRDVTGAFDEFIALLDPSYASHAPQTVGIAQYPGGAEMYAELIRLSATVDLSPRDVHNLGLERMARIREQLARTVSEANFSGDAKAYHARANADPQWRAETVEGVIAMFERYIKRIEPEIPQYFSTVPTAPCGAAPLPEALASSMTFGYYEAPTPERARGTYLFNARNLTQRCLIDVGPLTYHELVPGHHLHMAGELENRSLHPLRVHSFFNAFNEGWAEYASTLAGEMGMYETADERFARLVLDAFLSSRLVVDTGMNALGWSLSQAREYMSENTFHSQSEIETETIRYSCDIPAQSLAYKIGEPILMRLREKMHKAMGMAFDIKAFHDAVLAPGSLPYTMVEAEVDRAITDLL
jgi:uncharacterized protein (DUF885 family)